MSCYTLNRILNIIFKVIFFIFISIDFNFKVVVLYFFKVLSSINASDSDKLNKEEIFIEELYVEDIDIVEIDLFIANIVEGDKNALDKDSLDIVVVDIFWVDIFEVDIEKEFIIELDIVDITEPNIDEVFIDEFDKGEELDIKAVLDNNVLCDIEIQVANNHDDDKSVNVNGKNE